MEGSRKRKATNATPSSADGSASKKLRLLVRILFFSPVAHIFPISARCLMACEMVVVETWCCGWKQMWKKRNSFCDAQSVEHAAGIALASVSVSLRMSHFTPPPAHRNLHDP